FRSCVRGFFKSYFAAGAIAAIVLLFSLPCVAQLSTASVNGVIRAPKGAVIPGAAVVLHNVDTGVDHQSVSNDSGAFVITNIVPGKYTLRASAAGFRQQQVAPFVLAVDQIAT